MSEEARIILSDDTDKLCQKSEIGEIVENLRVIRDSEPEMLAALNMLIKHVAGTYGDKYAKGSQTIDTKKMLYSENGKAINIYQVCRYLQRYSTEGCKKSNLMIDLEKAIHYLLFEMTRRVRQNEGNEVEPKI